MSRFITPEGYIFTVECYSEGLSGSHEVAACSATTEEQAIRNWNVVVKNWQKQREQAISARTANATRKNK